MNKYVSFKLTNNSKVRFRKNHDNTFSLASGRPEDGGTCVNATVGEGGCVGKCYDVNLRKLYKKYSESEDYNTSLVWGKSFEEHLQVIENSVDKWLLNGGHTEPYFRIHTGGEFFDESYTTAWATAIKKRPEVRFWAYTRSLFAVPLLADLRNLTLMLSCDPINKDKVLAVYEKYKDYANVAIAWMGNTPPSDLPEDRARLICPEVTGKMKKNEDKGACARCRACIDRPLKSGKIRHIQFPIHR
jgi:hypothetical protein